MTTTVVGVFKNRESAQQAILKVEQIGITDKQIGLLLSDESRRNRFSFIESSKADEGATFGASAGGLLGTLAGGLLSAGVMIIPGLNLVVTGTLVTALAGLGAGALTGGLVGGLIGAGLPEHEAKIYEKEIEAGNALVSVKTETTEQYNQVDRIFRDAHAYQNAA